MKDVIDRANSYYGKLIEFWKKECDSYDEHPEDIQIVMDLIDELKSTRQQLQRIKEHIYDR